MIGKIFGKIRRKLHSPPAPPSSWDVYKDYVKVHPTAIIDPAASVKIFNPPVPPRICLEIGEGSHIFSTFALLRPEAKITVGKRCQLGASHFVAAERITVGDDVLMAWGVTVMDTDAHSLEWEFRQHDVARAYKDYIADPSNLIKTKDWSHVAVAAIDIADRCWIGFNASILKGVSVGNNAVIGACSVVVRNVPAFTLAAGNPAAAIKDLHQGNT